MPEDFTCKAPNNSNALSPIHCPEKSKKVLDLLRKEFLFR